MVGNEGSDTMFVSPCCGAVLTPSTFCEGTGGIGLSGTIGECVVAGTSETWPDEDGSRGCGVIWAGFHAAKEMPALFEERWSGLLQSGYIDTRNLSKGSVEESESSVF